MLLANVVVKQKKTVGERQGLTEWLHYMPFFPITTAGHAAIAIASEMARQEHYR